MRNGSQCNTQGVQSQRNIAQDNPQDNPQANTHDDPGQAFRFQAALNASPKITYGRSFVKAHGKQVKKPERRRSTYANASRLAAAQEFIEALWGCGGEKPPAPPKHTLRRPFLAAAWEFLRLQFSWAKPIPRCPHLATARKLAVLQRHGGGWGWRRGRGPHAAKPMLPPGCCPGVYPSAAEAHADGPRIAASEKNIEVPHGRSPRVAEAHTPMPPPSRRFFLVSQH